MRNIFKVMLRVGCCFIIFTSCQRDDLVEVHDLPRWLTESIKADEAYVLQNPSSMKAYGTWTRTTWIEEFYYEYFNPLSSSLYRPISHHNDTLPLYIDDINTNYLKEKCCDKIVWKGPAVKHY